jgi:serine/threonine-protein kinase HipA
MPKTNQQKEILVYTHWLGIKEPVLMGTLYSRTLRGKEIFSFEYSAEWLKTDYLQIIDPDLNFYKGQQYINDQKSNFGIFLDSSPDRWGRILMRRREAVLARAEERPEKTLLESDYLLGVYDIHRVGALRFKEDIKGPFLNFDKQFAVPPMTSLNELEQISLKIEQEDAVDDPEYLNWLNMLIAPGSSLGGARPKASVIDNDQNLWIAKFPSSSDSKDVGVWEIVVHELAVNAGLNVAGAMIKKFSSMHHTFLSKRFDRKKNERIHFASAMTMLGYTDGINAQEGASYLELVDFLTANGASVDEDLKELWKRIVFNIAVTNTDDHLRNHGFILTEKGWILSPAYDINPIETGNGLKLNISENDNSLDFDLVLSVAEYFRLEKEKAEKIIRNIKEVVSNWRSLANKFKIPKSEQELMSKAFRT